MSQRILVAILCVAAASVISFGTPLAIAVSRNDRADAIVRLEREATTAATQVPASTFLTGDPFELPRPDAGTRLAVYDQRGNRLRGDGPAKLDARLRGVLRGKAVGSTAGPELLAAVPVSSEEHVVAVVRAGKARGIVNDQIHRAWLAMAAIAALVLAGAAAVGALLARRLVRPIQELASTASRLGEGDFSVRTQPSGVAEVDTVGAALDVTAGRLDELLGRERRFTADASHQLRTPLAGLRLELESAVEALGTDPHDAIASSLEQVDRLERTIDDLLALHRDTAAHDELLDIDALFHDAEQRWHGVLARQGRPLRVRLDRPATPVEAPAAALRQVLDVLLSNAVEHGAGTVTLAARTTPGGVVLEVSDEGPGIGTEDTERIFDRRQPNEARGIGLALARSLSEAAGGRLRLRAAGPQPTFSLVFPTQTPES